MLEKKTLVLILGALLFCYMAFFNGYPLVTSDSGAYINNGYELYMPKDRPLTYSIFLRIMSLSFSNWLVIIVQGFILSFLSIRVIRALFQEPINAWIIYSILLLTVSFTTASWFCSQLMPDIFTAYIALLIILFLLGKDKIWQWVYLFFIFAFGLMHNSNFITIIICSILLIIFSYKNILIERLRCWRLLGAGIMIYFTLSLAHLVTGHGFVPSMSSHVFIIGKMSENGILKAYLDQNCANNQYQICQYKDNLPTLTWEFVWNPESPLYKTGGWDANKKEYNQIIIATLKSPKFLLMHIYKSIQHTMRQLTQIYIGEALSPQVDGSNTFWKIQEHFAHELPEYLNSFQNKQNIDFNRYNSIYALYLVFIIMANLALKQLIGYNDVLWNGVLMIIFIFFLSNAFSTAVFSNVLARLNARVFWIIPFLLNIHLIKMLFIFWRQKGKMFIKN